MLKDQIRRLRKASGLSQSELSSILNVSRQAVSSWESGKSVPNLPTLISLADAFGCTTDLLLERNTSSYFFPAFSLTDDEAAVVMQIIRLFELNKNLPHKNNRSEERF